MQTYLQIVNIGYPTNKMLVPSSFKVVFPVPTKPHFPFQTDQTLSIILHNDGSMAIKFFHEFYPDNMVLFSVFPKPKYS